MLVLPEKFYPTQKNLWWALIIVIFVTQGSLFSKKLISPYFYMLWLWECEEAKIKIANLPNKLESGAFSTS